MYLFNTTLQSLFGVANGEASSVCCAPLHHSRPKTDIAEVLLDWRHTQSQLLCSVTLLVGQQESYTPQPKQRVQTCVLCYPSVQMSDQELLEQGRAQARPICYPQLWLFHQVPYFNHEDVQQRLCLHCSPPC